MASTTEEEYTVLWIGTFARVMEEHMGFGLWIYLHHCFLMSCILLFSAENMRNLLVAYLVGPRWQNALNYPTLHCRAFKCFLT